ncbi:acetyl esterase/lipase [Nitrospirillum amazonense]|uniref:Acetyl esterase/lipase n=2 Tax=Nitrospirillum amazonense TaxID=28077 RepID=A0A560F9V8_9PROT|nr:acetyl esterase/lipase [Nitrospirillum amazonense]TWB66105.1 acetyl esterase/lipase [Nitrospirillum amazonense]
MRRLSGLVIALMVAVAGGAAFGQTAPVDPARVPPDTLSPAWQRMWPTVTGFKAAEAPQPALNDLAAWKQQQDAVDEQMQKMASGVTAAYGVTVEASLIGGVPTLTITPKDWVDDGRLLIYVHGGGFTSLSARSTLFSSGLMANRSRMRVISVDYTLAPQQRWQGTTDQVAAVYRALLTQGRLPQGIGIFGDSAGGSIVAGTVLKLRDAGTPLPGAVLLWSPWSDVTATGDTYRTLASFDPALSMDRLALSAAAYADPADQKNPYVSPVYGDYARGFPPTLIQGGTREIFLSNMVRHYQAMVAGGVDTTLDLYEGMIHVFQPMAPGAPENVAAMKRVVNFWNRHLRSR